MLITEKFKANIETILRTEYCKTIETAKNYEKYNAVSRTIMGMIIDAWNDTSEAYKCVKQAYYLSAEFLMGRALGNNLINLGLYDEVRKALNEVGIDINEIEDIEEDAGLGNGGLGRLAACFMESGATKNLPLTGYGIRYSYGIFKQSIIDGFQVEKADNWLKYGDPWSVRREEDTVIVEFADYKVKAVPYDTPIIGYGTKNINRLRLFKAEAIEDFDYELFNCQKYDKAVKEKNRADDITRVVYPNDSNDEGKMLRLRQQYFFTSAAIKDIVKNYKMNHGNSFEAFKDYNAVQLNDTHPVVAIPELIRIFVDEEKMDFKVAFNIAVNVFSYTNHSILREALEEWDVHLFKRLIPRIYEIIEKIDEAFVNQLMSMGYSKNRIDGMRIIHNGRIRMAWLAIHGTHATNGVAQLHTNILKQQELKDWYELYPERFLNITNGITPRRWLRLCDTELSEMITELLHSDKWVKELDKLKELEKYIDDEVVLNKLLDIKRLKKYQLAKYIEDKEGIRINPDSVYDIQIKRLHEYKRQLLNALYILDLYYRLKKEPNMDILPTTFIFGAKAAPGYFRAKGIIKFINEVAKLVNNDTDVNNKIKVVFVQNYGVSCAERLIPAADISEQISTAGKEASGTGNMKFMLNGAITLGTYDGANVEIVRETGEENNFIFGARVEEINMIKDSYKPRKYYENIPGLKKALDSLVDGTLSDGGTGMFKELYDSILEGTSWHRADNYFVLKDFADYREAKIKIDNEYRDRMSWAKKSLMNIANAGKFSSDRAIMEYANEIWGIKPKEV